MRTREEQNFIKSVDKAINKLETMITEKPEKYKDKLRDSALSTISRWYAKYDPIYYHDRQMSLKKAFKITQDGCDLFIDFDSSYMDDEGFTHHQNKYGNEIVFNNAFIKGYHGGSTSKKDDITTPHWRTPFPEFSEWGERAARSRSPYNEILKNSKKILKDYEDEWTRDLKQITDSVQRSFNGLLRK
jgi:hypothetical protein